MEKIAFESNKNELEDMIENIQIELDNTDMDVIRKGDKFMEPGSDHRQKARGSKPS